MAYMDNIVFLYFTKYFEFSDMIHLSFFSSFYDSIVVLLQFEELKNVEGERESGRQVSDLCSYLKRKFIFFRDKIHIRNGIEFIIMIGE